MLDYFNSYTMPLFALGLEMSECGVLADAKLLERFKQRLSIGVERKKERFEKLTIRSTIKKKKHTRKGEPWFEDIMVEQGVNPASPKQLMAWLYEELKLPIQYTIDQQTKQKRKTSNDEAVEKLGEKYGDKYLALRLLRWLRRASKMLSTYANVVLDADGRIHTIYQEVTETGRFSSKKTEDDEGLNMQNLPPWFRGVLIPDPGKVLVEWDLSQAEARIVAYLAGEEDMIAVFSDPKRNIHKLNVSKIFGIPEDQVVKDSRPTQPYGMSKKCTHGWDYLLGDRHAAHITGKSVAEMAKHREEYYKAYPNIPKWHQFIRNISLSSKILITPFGRRRVFLGRPPKRNEAGQLFPDEDLVRKMVAWVPQSTCTEYLKRGMLRMQSYLPEGAEFLMDLHDGALLQCWPKDVEALKALIEVKTCVPLPIKDIFGKERLLTISAEISVGNRWGKGMK